MPQRLLAALSAALIAVALIWMRPAGEPGVIMRDFEAYYSAGATWLAHGDAYSLDIWQSESRVPGVVTARYEVLPFVGLPATLPFWAIFARMPYEWAVRVWAAVLAAAFLAIVACSVRALRASSAQMLCIALLALAFVPMTSDFGLGQAAMPAYAFALIALVATPVLSMIAAVFASLQPNVTLGLLAMVSERRTTMRLVVAAVVIYLAGALASGPQWPLTYARILAGHGLAERDSAIQYSQAAIFYGFGIPHPIAQMLTWLVTIAAVVLAVIGAVRADTLVHRFAILCCALPFATGFFHEHDFVTAFLPMAFVLLNSKRAAWSTAACVLIGVNWLDFAQQPQALAQDLILAAGLLTAAVSFTPRRDQLWAVIICAGLVLGGAWLGATHPLPIWPNDMAGAAHGTRISEVWKNEQLQTGLMRPDAAAALLRTFALIGSALLFYLVLDVDVHHVVERRNRVRMEVLEVFVNRE